MLVSCVGPSGRLEFTNLLLCITEQLANILFRLSDKLVQNLGAIDNLGSRAFSILPI